MDHSNNLILGLTSIGQILEDNLIRSSSGAIRDFELVIPQYQRPYKWTSRNAIQLLDDIIEAQNDNKEVYRVGTLILHQELKGGKRILNVVDGQQRLITFSLLLFAIYEALDEIDKALNIGFLNQKINTDAHSKRNIPNNLNAIRRRIGKNPADGLAKEQFKHGIRTLKDFILNQCELIVVITSNQSEAFQFFDSQNARGKALYPHDLLKAYHLREMADTEAEKTEKIVKKWEKVPQDDLNEFFSQYLYRLREWMHNNYSYELNEQTIYKFKGINRTASSPYAQFFKGAYSYAQLINNSAMPFVTGSRELNTFQLTAPIIAGEPFFRYTHFYLNLLRDIQNNNKFEGFYIKNNDIVKTLDTFYKHGTGNRIVRLMFDTSLLLYIDRFCPPTFPSKQDTRQFEQFVVLAFIWAYSLRAQFVGVGWQSAQSFILNNRNDKENSFNLYRMIIDAESPASLLSVLSDTLNPIESVSHRQALKSVVDKKDELKDGGEVYVNYLHFFRIHNFLNNNLL